MTPGDGRSREEDQTTYDRAAFVPTAIPPSLEQSNQLRSPDFTQPRVNMIQFAGFDCLDPVALHKSLQRGSQPVDTSHWFPNVNFYRTSLGLEPAEAKLLMHQQHVVELDRAGQLDAPHVLEFSIGQGEVKLKDLYVERYDRIYPAAEDDHTSAMIVRLTDRRGVLKRIPVDKRYNVYECPCGEVLSATKNGGSLWTWSEMVGDLWAVSSALGTFPGLPFTPHGTPSNFVFEGQTLFEALTHVFTRLSVAPFHDPIRGTWQIFQLGKASDVTRATQAIDAWTRAGLKVWDDFPGRATRTRIPEKARVTFRKQPLPNDGTSWEYHLDVSPTTPLAGETEAGTVAILWDDLPALYCSAGEPSATLANSSDLTARAAERAADYYRLQEKVLAPRRQAFMGVRADSLLGLYGGAAVMMAIQDRGAGYKWELLGGRLPPGQDLEAWMPHRRFDMGACGEGEDPDPDPDGGTCTGCGWLLDVLRDRDKMFAVTLPRAVGRCDCIPLDQGDDPEGRRFVMFYDTATDTWEGTALFQTCCSCGELKLTVAVDDDLPLDHLPELTLTVRQSCNDGMEYEYKLRLKCCPEAGVAIFAAAGTDNCDGDPECDNTFEIRIECQDCDLPNPGCENCLAGFGPPFWKGIIAGFTGDQANYNGKWYLQHDTACGCSWSANCNGVTVTLTVNEDNITVTFSGSGADAVFVYETQLGDPPDCRAGFTASRESGTPGSVSWTPIACQDEIECCPTRYLPETMYMLVEHVAGGGDVSCLNLGENPFPITYNEGSGTWIGYTSMSCATPGAHPCTHLRAEVGCITTMGVTSLQVLDQSFLASTTPGDVCSGELSTKDVASNLNCPFGPLNACCEWFVGGFGECCSELSPDPEFTMCLFEGIPNEGESCDTEELSVMATPPIALGDSSPKVMAPVSARRSREIRDAARKAARPTDGPGTELRALLAELGLPNSKGCQCKSRQSKMNEWGLEGCRANRAEIEGWLRGEAKKVGWRHKLKAAALGVWHGIVVNPLDPAPGLLDTALERWRSKVESSVQPVPAADEQPVDPSLPE